MESNASDPPSQTITETGGRRVSDFGWGRRWATFLLLALLGCCAISEALRGAAPYAGIDFYQFWAVGRAVGRRESSDIYSDAGRTRLGNEFLVEAMREPNPQQRAVAAHRRVFETTASPFLYAVFGTFSTSDYGANLAVYRALLIGCFGLSILGISKLIGLSITNTLVSISLLSIGFEPLASDLRVGNVSCIQLAGLVAYAWLLVKTRWRASHLVAGCWLGLLIAFKPNLGIVAALLLLGSILGRKWRSLLEEAAGIAVGLGAAIGISSFAFGSVAVWFDWVQALRRIPSVNISVEAGNVSPAMLVRADYGNIAGLAMALSIVGGVGFGLFTQRRGARRSPPTAGSCEAYRVAWLMAIGCLGLVLVPRLAWLHYFVLTVPALLLVLAHAPKKPVSALTLLWYGMSVSAWLGLAVNPLRILGVGFTLRSFATLTVIATCALLCSLSGAAAAPE
jgi:hypothetical protein